MADSDTTVSFPPRRRPFLWNGGRVEGFLGGIEHRLEEMGTVKTALVLGGGVLVLDHLIAPKGQSFLTKAWEKVSGRGHGPAIPPPIPAMPPPALAHPSAKVGHWYNFPSHPELFEQQAAEAAAGDFAGANMQAGWNRGMSPYGAWAVADPMGQYAHAAQSRRTGHMGHYDWE